MKFTEAFSSCAKKIIHVGIDRTQSWNEQFLQHSDLKKVKGTKVNLGSGRKNPKGFLNFDIEKYPQVHIQCDLQEAIPLRDNCVSECLASHFLEHLENPQYMRTIREIVRVCKHGGKVTFIVPYFSYEMAMVPSHNFVVPPEMFRLMETNKQFREDLFGSNGYLKLESIKYKFTREGWKFCKKLGINPQEGAKFLCNVVREIKVEMRVVKNCGSA